RCHMQPTWFSSAFISRGKRPLPTTSAAGRRPSRPIRARPVTNAHAGARGLPIVGLRGGGGRRPDAVAFGTRSCADGRRAAQPRGEEAPRGELGPSVRLRLPVLRKAADVSTIDLSPA